MEQGFAEAADDRQEMREDLSWLNRTVDQDSWEAALARA
jgi:hypothetical protein